MTSQIENILSNMKFGAPRNNLNGIQGRNVPLTVHNGKEFHLTTPPCTAPFGKTRRENKDSMESISLALCPLQAESKHMQFLSKMDQAIVAHAHANQQDFFGTSGKSIEVIADRYYPCVKNKNANYDPFFEAKLKYKDGTPTFKLTDAENNEIANVEKGSIITAQISYPSLWLSNTGFGLNSKLISAVISPPVNSNISSYAIKDDD